MDDVIFALLDTSSAFPDARWAARVRELTIAFTRFKYTGPILEHSDPEALLQLALASGARYCVMQAYGCLLAEVWRPDDGEMPGWMTALRDWTRTREFLFAAPAGADEVADGRSVQGLLVIDLERCRRITPPVFGYAPPDVVTALPPVIARNVVTLDRLRANGAGTAESAGFLTDLETLTRNLRRAVFVWNIESYADVETRPHSFQPPLQALYTVAAGFKPNRMLETHGFTSATRMVVFDYSARGLEYRRLLHEEWEGEDYPGFLRTLFRRLPPADTHYLLWHGVTPDSLDWTLVERRWQEELTAWGGAEALYEHWQRFRQMRIEYLHCDLLVEPALLLDRIGDEDGALIWWSNAFFSMHSIWHYSAARRRELFSTWVEALARRAPRLWLHGSDCNNCSINGCTAGEYAAWLQTAHPDPLDGLRPGGLNRLQMRY